MLRRMNKTLPLLLAASVLAGCATDAQLAASRAAVQQAAGAARTMGAHAEPGGVSSGGTGYLPLACPGPQAPAAAAPPGCK
jgi:hypothetical protein